MNKLFLDGKYYTKESVETVVAGDDFANFPSWRKKIFQFLLAWWNDDPDIIQHTSGSTGTPKPIALAKRSMLSSAKRTCQFFSIDGQSRIGLCLSADYIAGKMMIVRSLVSGAELIAVAPEGHPYKDFSGHIDFVAMVPLQADNMLQRGEEVRSTCSFTTILLGGADISPALEEQIGCEETAYYLGYGMTETCSHIALKRLGVADSSYTTMDAVSLCADDRGCLVIDDPATNSQPLITNDLVEITEHGFIWKGRFDNIINSGGIKFSPEDLEQKISSELQNPFIISSVADERLGQKIVLIIEDVTQNQMTRVLGAGEKEQYLRKIRHLLPRYACPHEVIIVSQLSRTQNGKINRQASY